MKALDVVEFLGLPWKIITDDASDPYLLRVRLTPEGAWWRRRLPGVVLHYFFRGDHEREYHNHPWRWALSFILSRGYIEHRKDGRYAPPRVQYLQPGALNVIWKDTYHRVELSCPERGAWSLVILAPREGADDAQSEWGFTPADGSTYESWQEREARVKRERARAQGGA